MTQTCKDGIVSFFVWAGNQGFGVKNSVWGEQEMFVG